MITKVNAFLTTVGNIFKTKEEAIREERENVLKKYMLKKECTTTWPPGWKNRYDEYKTITTFVPDQDTINQFLDNYDDIMAKLKEVDKNKDT